MSSHLMNEFRSLCVIVYDATAFGVRPNGWEADCGNLELDWSANFHYSSTTIERWPCIG